MKRTILTVILIFGAILSAYGQNTSPIDLVLLLDTSTAMSSSYENVNNYITGSFLKEFLRVGDTFHLVPFSGNPRLDVARRINGVGDVETIIGRMLLQYPVENAGNVSAAVTFAEQYITTLPSRPKKIVVVSLGSSDTGNVINASKQRLGTRATIDYVQVTPGRQLSNLPSSGRPSPVRPAPAVTAAPSSPATTTPSTAAQDTRATSTSPTGTTQTGSGSSATSSTAAGGRTTTGTTSTTTPPTAPSATGSSATGAGSSGTTSRTETTSTTGSGSTGTVTAPASSTGSSSSTDTSRDSSSGTVPATTSGTTSTGTRASSETSGSSSGSSQTVSESASSTDTTSSYSAEQKENKSKDSIASKIPLIIIIIIAALLLLGLIILLASRRLNSSPNRVMRDVSSSDSNSDVGAFKDHSKDLANYAAGSSARRSTPYDDIKIKTDNVKRPVINPSGPLLLNLFVEDQNTSIGKRNIHSLKSGYSLSVGGGKADDYLIFLVPMPPALGEIRREGATLTFIPKKPKYFPDIGSNPVRDCINKTVRIVSDKKYEMHFRFEMYEDPLIALNRMLMSVKVPG